MATQFSAALSSSDEALSNGNLTATSSGAGTAVASRVMTSLLSYYEFDMNTFGGTMYAGLVNSQFNPSNNQPGLDGNGCGLSSAGAVLIGGSAVATVQSFAAGAKVGVAVNLQLGLVWFTTNGTTWNNAAIGSQNPAGNVGGISLATMSAGPLSPAAGSSASGASITAAFSSGAFAYTPPSGYASVDACGVSSVRNSQAGLSHTYSAVGGGTPAPVAPGGAQARASTLGPGQSPGAFSPAGAVTRVAGAAAEGGAPKAVPVRVYDSATGVLVGQATSSAADGTFSIPAAGRTAVDVVVSDVAAGKIQIYQSVNPE